jgi:hypothetical protein
MAGNVLHFPKALLLELSIAHGEYFIDDQNLG